MNKFGDLWTDAETELLKKYLGTEKSLQDISDIFSETSSKNKDIKPRSLDAIRKKITRIRKITDIQIDTKIDNDEGDEEVIETPEDDMSKFLVKKQALLELTKQHRPRNFTKHKIGLVKGTKKYLVLSDMHFPIVEADLLLDIICQHNDADGVILNGDLLDGYIYSTYQKSKQLAAIDEYRSAFDFIKSIQPFFKDIWITEGNHDARIYKYLSDKFIPSAASSLFQPNLLARMANGEELSASGDLIKKHNWENVHFDRLHSWYVRIGNAVVAHPHFTITSSPGMGVKKTAEMINKIYPPNLIDCLIVGHTHAVYKGVVNGQLLIEQGCLTTFTEYSFSPRSTYITAPALGYAVLYQDNDGNTDFNKSGFIYCGRTTPKIKQGN